MKNILIGVFAGISVLSLGFITYDKFIKEEKIIYKECNKEELCDKCVCNDDYEEESNNYFDIESSGIYSKDGKVYKLYAYKSTGENADEEYIKLNNKSAKIEKKSGILYFNDKKVNHADILYVTSNYIVTGSACQNGLCFMNAITSDGSIIDLDNHKTIGEFQTEEIYLTDNGNLVAIGGKFCGLDCSSDKEIVTFSYTNGKLQITKDNK